MLDSNIVFDENYLLRWDIFINKIIQIHHKNGYKRFFLKKNNDLDKKIFSLGYNKVDYLDSLFLCSYSIFDDKVSAKSEALNMLSSYSNIVEDMTSMSLIEGYYNGNKDEIVSGVILNGRFVALMRIIISYIDNKYVTKIEYFHQIIEVVHKYQLEIKAINSNLSINRYGGIVLENNSIKTKKIIEKIKDLYEIDFANEIDKTKEKYSFLEDKGYNFIFEFRKNGKLRIKCPVLDLYQDILEEEIEFFIRDCELEINKKIYQVLFKKNYFDLKRNQKSVCNDCIDKNYIKLFNQRISGNCYKCGNKALMNIILL